MKGACGLVTGGGGKRCREWEAAGCGDATGYDVVVLGLEGFRVLGVVEDAAELVITVETVAEERRCPGCGGRATGKGRQTVVVPVAADGRPAGAAPVAETPLVLSRPGMSEEVVVGDPPRDPPPAGALGTGPSGSLPAGR